MTKQKKNELKEEPQAEENGTNGTYETNVTNEVNESHEANEINETYENTELTAEHTSHLSHTTQDSHSSPQKAFYAIIREALAQGQGLSLPGLGSFSVMLHAARMGRNPRTGETITIPARRRIHFKTGKVLRELLNS